MLTLASNITFMHLFYLNRSYLVANLHVLPLLIMLNNGENIIYLTFIGIIEQNWFTFLDIMMLVRTLIIIIE